MGKKSMKNTPKHLHHEKKQQIHSMIKILRPKVYITDSSNFKKLVQELTGNNPVVVSSPPSSVSVASQSTVYIQDHGYQENYGLLDLSSFDSPCFSTPLEAEGSPDQPAADTFNYVVENSILESEKIGDFSSEYNMDLESLLMGMDSVSSYNCDAYNYGMIHQQEVCVYDYGGLSGFMI